MKKILLESDVSAMGKRAKKIVEQWCFSNGEKGKKFLNSGEERGSSVSQNEAWLFLK